MATAGLLLLPLLLCFWPETAGSIDPAKLKAIVNHVNRHGGVAPRQYSFAVSLRHRTCRDLHHLRRYLPERHLESMKARLSRSGGLYNHGHIVAARPRHMVTPRGNYTEHSEWRLLSGTRSLVARLKARTYGQNSCLILFTFNSPCSTKCLREAGRDNIVWMTSDAFQPLDNNYKAFVFQTIFHYDLRPEVSCQALLDAWHLLHNVTLLRCDKNSCKDCAAAEPQNNPCLAGKR